MRPAGGTSRRVFTVVRCHIGRDFLIARVLVGPVAPNARKVRVTLSDLDGQLALIVQVALADLISPNGKRITAGSHT